MKEWTLEQRYTVLEDPEQIRALHEGTKTSVYRQTYHVQPVTGLSSDPNGFAYYQGKWHLFYQWCPWGAVHGLKYWYHVSSEDLMHWKNEGDCRGCLLDVNMKEKPIYQALYQLIQRNWKTHAEGETDENGVFAFRGFCGDYSLTAECGAGRLSRAAGVHHGADNETLIVL